jgi:hypothetical protein
MSPDDNGHPFGLHKYSLCAGENYTIQITLVFRQVIALWDGASKAIDVPER